MPSKKLYLHIIQHYGPFRLQKKDRASTMHFNEAVTVVNAKIAEKYGISITAMSHMVMTLGHQMLNDLAEELSELTIKKVLSGEVKVPD